ncbi:hypothetical protein N0B40_18500 [Chryseobacterium oranimense]|uniref:hypothetical protein n=1 Tax=Chryseobacterium oranimense TaxID=421058 RepID=UPI0021AFC92E|nr:hypothetical protein [Chryseobacterium oranimense]UWX60377.1 hypothetical protein N0B40_18500 [Chryseobacterium oranimense]
MRKTYFLLIYTLLGNWYYGQSESMNQVTNIVPPSPQAYSIIQYGNQPLNEFKGMAQINLPVTQIKQKDLFNSVELKYSKLGVKVNDISSNVGASWILDMGGVITRTIFDLPDEMQNPSKRLFFNSVMEMANMPYAQNGSAEASQINSYVKDENIDNEVDVFNISVNGLTGSFYLDKNLMPVMLQDNHQFKIETVGNFAITHEFVLTSNDGIKYYFGGDAATEITKIREASQYNGITSFYLTKMKSVTGQEINFQYNNVGSKAFATSKYEEKVVNGVNMTYCQYPLRSLGQSEYLFNSNILRIEQARVLSKIIGDEMSIFINYDAPNNASTLYERVTSIDVLNKNVLHQNIEFEYLDKYSSSNTLQRFFLTKMKKYYYKNGVKIFDNEHSFDYESPLEIPDRNSFSVDVFGYYNGKVSNNTLVPDLNLLADTPLYNNLTGLNLADRRSVFNEAVKGTLKSITYPTKGKTLFEYEAMPKKVKTAAGSTGEVHSNPPNSLIAEHSTMISGRDVLDNILNITLYAFQETPSPIPNNMGTINFKIIDVATNTVLDNKDLILVKSGPDDVGPATRDLIYTFQTLPEKQYKLIMTLTKPNIKYMGTYDINYYNGYTSINEAGLRLKKTYDYDENNNINIKRLYYSSYNNINNLELLPNSFYSPGMYLKSRYDFAACREVYPNGEPGGITLDHASLMQTILSSETVNEYFGGESFKSPSYPAVTISYGGDNFEKGGEEKTFANNNFDELVILHTASANNDFYGNDVSILTSDLANNFRRNLPFDGYNGKLLEDKIFKRENGQLFLEKKAVLHYDLLPSKDLFNLVGKETYLPFSFAAGLDPNNVMHNLFLAYYPRKSYSTLLNNKIETVYFDNVEIGVVDDSSYKKMTTTKNYFYNNPLHYQVTQEKTTYPDNTVLTTNFGYAHEKGNQLMIDRNMIGIPLETTITEINNGITKTVAKTATIYPSSLPTSQTGNLVLPLSVQKFDKDNTASAKNTIDYNQYDTQGNILQYTTKGNVPTAIIWGYNNTLPVAKVEGANYQQVMSLAADIIARSNADVDVATEKELITALDTFRNQDTLKDYSITTYTYDPFIGVTTVTPSTGLREFYKYDAAGRLQSVVDANGNILKEMNYNYKH